MYGRGRYSSLTVETSVGGAEVFSECVQIHQEMLITGNRDDDDDGGFLRGPFLVNTILSSHIENSSVVGVGLWIKRLSTGPKFVPILSNTYILPLPYLFIYSFIQSFLLKIDTDIGFFSSSFYLKIRFSFKG